MCPLSRRIPPDPATVQSTVARHAPPGHIVHVVARYMPGCPGPGRTARRDQRRAIRDAIGLDERRIGSRVAAPESGGTAGRTPLMVRGTALSGGSGIGRSGRDSLATPRVDLEPHLLPGKRSMVPT